MSGKVEIPGASAEKETPKALLVRVDGVAVWVPKSQIHDDSEVYEVGHVGKLVVPRWLAEAKGLVEVEDPDEDGAEEWRGWMVKDD